MAEQFSQVVQDLLYAQEHDLPLEEAIQQSFRHGVAGSFEQQTLRKQVQNHRTEQAFAGLFSSPKLKQGDLVLGFDTKGHEIRIPSNYLNEHTYIQGSTGSGKTTLARWLLLQICRTVSGMFVFDFRKTDFANLAPLFDRVGKQLIVLEGRDLRLNLLEIPPGVSPADYAPNVAEMLSRILHWPPGATRVLHAILLQLYVQFAGSFPTLFDLYIAVENIQTMHAQTRRAILDSLAPVLFSLREMLACRRGYPIESLMQHQIAFQLGGNAEIDKDLIVNTLILQAMMLKMGQGVVNPDQMELFILCDECGRLVGREDSSLSDLIQVSRGCGTGMALLNQSSRMSPSVLSNTPNKIIGRCSSYHDMQVIGSSIGLTAKQQQWLLQNLVPGQFLMSIAQGSWRRPFLCRVPFLKIPKQSSQNGQRASLPFMETELAPEFLGWKPGWVEQITSSTSKAESQVPDPTATLEPKPQSSVNSTSTFQNPHLTPDERRLLQAIFDVPGRSVSEYPKRARMAPRKAATLRKSLKAKGLISEELIQQKQRGRPAIHLTPTKLAMEILKP